jgi:hypothetical protein
MISIHDTPAWERPFVTLQHVMDRFVAWTGRLPGIVQLVLYPLALALSLLHIPFALTHLLVFAVVNRIYPRKLPILTRDELREWALTASETWAARHATLGAQNPSDVADDIALPVVDALRDAADALDTDKANYDDLKRLADRLVDLHLRTAPDAHTLGLCIRQSLLSDTGT